MLDKRVLEKYLAQGRALTWSRPRKSCHSGTGLKISPCMSLLKVMVESKGLSPLRVLRLADKYGWKLENAVELSPDKFASQKHPIFTMPIKLNLNVFKVVDPDIDPAQLPLWQLDQVIEQLKLSGSSVDRLITAWHSKWAYAFSLLDNGSWSHWLW